MREADKLAGIYDYLVATVASPVLFDDLLRARVVYSVSAFDKLMHDLISNGMVLAFSGHRVPTAKYLSEPITLAVYQQLSTTVTPPPASIFEQAVQSKLKLLSFQDPDKVSDGLSYIWSEAHKWSAISKGIGLDEKSARTKLRLIVTRRNAIVHEADTDPITHQKIPISRSDTDDIAKFLLDVGEEICRLVS